MLHRLEKAGRLLPIEHVVLVARAVTSALHYAHDRCGPDGSSLGIVHRDVSPSNVLVSYEGTVKLLDFGVAKAASSTVQTRTGSLKGKVAYMSPEQAKGAAIDRRSDIFAAGILLWEMVARRRLFKADNDLATIQLIIHQDPPAPSSLRADCPPELDRIILRALSKQPEDRYQTAQELQLDLDELAREAKLNQSSIPLAAQMSQLFAVELDAWKRAQATGVSLANHIIEMSERPADSTPGGEFVSAPDDLDPSVEVDQEKTEQSAPPIALPVAPPVTPMRRRVTKAPRDFAIVKEPSVVIEPALIEESAVDAPPAIAATPVPAVVIAPIVARRRPWIAVAIGAAVAVVIGIFVIRSSSESHPASTPPTPVVAAPQPVATDEVPAPVPTAAIAPSPASPPSPPIAAPKHQPPPAAALTKRPIHRAPPKPAVKPASKFDPNAAMPPM